MSNYVPPLQDLGFVLQSQLGLQAILDELPRYAGISVTLFPDIAEEVGRFAVGQVLGLNAGADRIGCKWQDGKVVSPPGFVRAYRTYCELGWPAVCAEPADGGQGLPRLAFSVINEILSGASHAFVMVAAINHFAAVCLRASASESIRQSWLSKLASGEVLSSMCMTEPQAGSDLGLVTTRACDEGDGSFLINGTKIFASGGEHDLTENILHLVLARLDGAPSGTRGLSLFLVPKLAHDGAPNHVVCDGIEHKMGLHGSATCTLRFDGARGWMVGEPHQGLRAMFPMMNEARLMSGLQAVGISDSALQMSLTYARERRQGRAPAGRQPCALVEHPDVQRMLMLQKAWTEGGRALVSWTAALIDVADWHPDAARRADTMALVGLLTPVIKGFLTENAQQSIAHALQIHGGHGYVTETGVEQLARDARVLTIYEGTTAIQAQDLLLRKILVDGGRRLTLLEEHVRAWLADGGEHEHLREFTAPLLSILESSKAMTAILARREQAAPGASLSACTNYLRLVGHLIFAYLWARAAGAAWAQAQAGDPWHRTKVATARFYFSQMLPETSHLIQAMTLAPDDMQAFFVA